LAANLVFLQFPVYKRCDDLHNASISGRNSARDDLTNGREIVHAAAVTIPKQEIIFPINRISLMKSEHIDRVLVYTEIYVADLG